MFKRYCIAMFINHKHTACDQSKWKIIHATRLRRKQFTFRKCIHLKTVANSMKKKCFHKIKDISCSPYNNISSNNIIINNENKFFIDRWNSGPYLPHIICEKQTFYLTYTNISFHNNH